MKLYSFLILKTKDDKNYEKNFIFAANLKEAKQKARKYISIYRKRNGLPFAKVYPYFLRVKSVVHYEYVFKNWDGSIHADEDGVITIGKALL